MKTIKNILGILLALAAMTAFYACEDEPKYTPAETPTGAQVFFPSSNSANISLLSTATSFDIPIARANTNDAATVPLTVSGGDGLYTIPTSVNFAQGASTSAISVAYDPEAVGFDNYSELKLSIGDGNTTEYGLSEYIVKVGIPAPWKSLGKCSYTEDFMTTFWAAGNLTYEVEIQENLLQPGLFRLVNPYGSAYPNNEPGDWDNTKDWYLEINAEDPTGVYINLQPQGIDWGYGNITMGSLAGYYMANGKTLEEMKAAGNTGTYEKGVITFPAGKLAIRMPGYKDNGLYGANGSGAFKVVMPGVIEADYSIDIAYAGKYMGTDDKVEGVLAQITEVGEDVDFIRIAVVKGNNINLAIEEIKSGNINSVEVPAEEGTVMVPFEEEPVEGTYSIVAVSYAGTKGEEAAYATFTFTPAE